MKRRVLRLLRKHRTALIALAVHHFVLFFPLLFMGRLISPNDVFYNFAPWQNARPAEIVHAQNSLLNDPPTAYYTLMSMVKADPATFHWNPYVACGIPGFGSSAAAMLSPFILLPTLLVPLPWVYTAIIFLKLNTAFFFAYWWLREERLGKRGAAIGALVVAAAGICAVRWMWNISNATTLYPALLWIVRRIANGKRVSIAMMALIGVAYAIAGFPASIAYGAWLVLAYAVFTMRRRALRGVARAAIALVIAILIALPMLIPFAQLIRRSGYLDVRKETSLQATFPRELWLNFVQPDRLGNPVAKDWRGDPRLGPLNNYIETTVYLGLLTIPLALLGLFNRRARARWFWLAAAAFVLACMFGAPLIAPIVARFPGFKYSALARLVLLLPLPAGYLAACGNGRLGRSIPQRARAPVATLIAALLAFDLGLFAGRFYPFLEPRLAGVPPTPMTRFLAAESKPFRIAPFFNYLWPNTAELVRAEDVRSHFGSEAAYRRMMLRLDPSSWSGTSTIITFNSLQYHFDDPLNALLGIRWFIEHREIDVIKWGIFKETEPAVKEIGTLAMKSGATFERTIRVESEPFWSIELPLNLEDGNGRVHVTLIRNGTAVWSRAFTKDEANVMNKVYVPLRPFARLGDTVTLRVRALGVRGTLLEAEGGFYYGRVKTPVMFDRALPDGKLFRNLAELPRFRAVTNVRKLNDDEFLAAHDVDFASQAVITDDPIQAPTLTPTNAGVTLTRYAADEQRIATDSPAPFYLASSEKLTPELAITIDGRPARPIETDLLFAGVLVPSGHHEVIYSRRIARGWWWVCWVGVGLWAVVVTTELRRWRSRASRAS